MMDIFICYRRSEATLFASAFYSRLEARVGATRVFMDVGTLGPGDEFGAKTSEAIRNCTIFFLLIGPNWEHEYLERDKNGQTDLVNDEIRIAKTNGKHVVPILFGREGQPLDRNVIGKRLSFLFDVNHEEIRESRIISDVDDLLRGLSMEFPGIFGSSISPVLVEDELAKTLLDIPFFSSGSIIPASANDEWVETGSYEFGSFVGDDFHFQVVEGNSKKPRICFFSGDDDATTVALCDLNKKSENPMRLQGFRSQYGFYWPQYYFTVLGSYGAQDYFYNSQGNEIFNAIWNWVFLRENDQRDNLRAAIDDEALGLQRRGVTSDDILIFPTSKPGPIRYFGWFNGLYPDTTSSIDGRGTVVQWSQRGGGYRDFTFILKDKVQHHSLKGARTVYYGRLVDGKLSVCPVQSNEQEELFVHPCGLPVNVTSQNGRDLLFQIGKVDDPLAIVDCVEFEGLARAGWPEISFSRDGRTIAISQPWERRTVITDLLTGTIVSVLPGYITPEFSPDGERLLAVLLGEPRSLSLFSKLGANKVDLGHINSPNAIQFKNMADSHYEIHPPYVWSDSGRKVFALKNNIVKLYQLKE